MKSSLAVVAVALTVAVTGCKDSAENAGKAHAEVETNSVAPVPPSASVSATVSGAARASTTEPSALVGPPPFAVLYPNGEIEGDPTTAGGAAGPGGMITFTTDAKPETVVAFYRERAEAAGLATTMSMNQGDARAYGAMKQDSGASVNVVASPVEERTSVLLSWSAGQ